MRRGDVIQVDRLGKTYPVYASPLDALKEVLTGRPRHQEAVALADVSFRVRQGERVGIVGANGAGKSTLLKILAGTVDHTAGRFRIRGRLRAILELGTGFHEECSGRDNILMGGMCLGYSRSELLERSDWIIEFSGLRAVIDRPLRTYSSGMKMRLMYAVAFCLPVEVMIIDEALATGDGAYLRKCTNHIVELCGGGTTALIVSHNLYFLERICHRVLYLREGRLVADGDPLVVCKQYEADLGRAFVSSVSSGPLPELAARPAGEQEPGASAASGPHGARDGLLAGAGAGSAADADGSGADPGGRNADQDAVLQGAAGAARWSPGEAYLRGQGSAGSLCGERAEPVPACAMDDRPLSPGLLDGDGPGGSRTGNGPGAVLQPDGRWEPVDFSGAPAVRALGLVQLLACRLYDEGGRPTEEIVTGRPCRFRFVLRSRVRKPAVHLGFMIWNDHDEHVATSTNVCSLGGRGLPNPRRLDLDAGVFSIDVVFPSLRLGAGRYLLRFGIAPGFEHFSVDDLLVSEDRCLAFSVLRPDHVQTVHYEPHSVWQPLQRLAPLEGETLPPLELGALTRPTEASTR